MNTWQTVYEQPPTREYMLDIIQKEIGSYIQHWWAIEWWWWKVYDPVMIWDVIDRIDKTWNYLDESYNYTENTILRKRKEKRKPLSEQSDDCIRYIYSLLPSEVRKISFKL